MEELVNLKPRLCLHSRRLFSIYPKDQQWTWLSIIWPIASRKEIEAVSKYILYTCFCKITFSKFLFAYSLFLSLFAFRLNQVLMCFQLISVSLFSSTMYVGIDMYIHIQCVVAVVRRRCHIEFAWAKFRGTLDSVGQRADYL